MATSTGTQELNELLNLEGGPFVSIYAPMQVAGKETRQNPIRFKNLVREAEQRLADEYGMEDGAIKELMKPARDLEDDWAFWQHQGEGLAVFAWPGGFRARKLPYEVKELAWADNRLYLRPLLPLYESYGRFYLLALSQQEVRLFEATREGMRHLHPRDLPSGMQDILQYTEAEKHLQHHTGAQPDGSGLHAPAIFHGHGGVTAEDEHRRRVFEFCRLIDNAMHELLRNEEVPLVLACVEWVASVYREANTYRHLLDQHVEGNVEHVEVPSKLYEAALPVVRPVFERKRQEAVAEFKEAQGSSLGLDRLEDIVPAAAGGRVSVLLVNRQQHVWGQYDPSELRCTVHTEREPRDRDLLELAAFQTLLNSGRVYTADRDELPEGVVAGAVLRY